MVVKPLQDLLHVKELPDTKELGRICEEIWQYILNNNWSLSLMKEVDAYHIEVEWSKDGYGYVLYAGSPDQGLLVGLNSKSNSENSSSYLGELRAM